jgi:hypothetical protein
MKITGFEDLINTYVIVYAKNYRPLVEPLNRLKKAKNGVQIGEGEQT